MKKDMRLWIVGLLLCALLAACGHRHTWQEATCLEPKTCTECGKTEGAAANHRWNGPTCLEPKTCAECGTAEGTALEHAYGEWEEAEQDDFGQWFHSRSCTLCGDRQTEQTEDPTIRTDLGSAGSPKGTTLIVSIFADERSTGWDFESETDRATQALMLNHMKSGTSWLTRQIGAYGAEARFIYDWEENPDLFFTYDFGGKTLVKAEDDGYWDQYDYVTENIPTDALKKKYQAQNMIYMFYFNTDETNTINSWAMGMNQNVGTEIINVFVRDRFDDSFRYVSASGLAHEIMHCFGAHDLYYASADIPQEYVDHCELTNSTDIMYTIGLGEEITQIFSRLDAYYLGLVDTCDEVTTWGLGKSAFLD